MSRLVDTKIEVTKNEDGQSFTVSITRIWEIEIIRFEGIVPPDLLAKLNEGS